MDIINKTFAVTCVTNLSNNEHIIWKFMTLFDICPQSITWVNILCSNTKYLSSFQAKETTTKLDQISHMMVDSCNPSPVRLKQEEQD